MRKLFSLACAVTWMMLVSVASAQQQAQKYNVLFIFADDLRAELGSYGGLAKTPNLDALAASSVKFDRAYCQYPLCNPSRSSMLTGHYPIYTGVLGNGATANWMTFHPDWISLPRLFKENGYSSLRTGKIFHGLPVLDDPKAWTEGGANQGAPVEQEGAKANPIINPIYAMQNAAATPVDRNSREYLLAGSAAVPGQAAQQARSDHWGAVDDGPSGGVTGSTRAAIDYLNRYKDKPFFLALGYSKPHSPLNTSLKFFQEYDFDKIPLPIDYAPRPTVPPGFPVGSIRPNNADLFIGRHESTPDTAKDMIRAYMACTTSVDWNVGLVLAELDRLKLREKTIIIFWGDHGYQLGEKGKWSKAGSVWEQGARVPTMIYVPGMAGNGKISPRVTESLDFYRTLADLCGLPVADHVQGRSLVPLLKDPNAEWNHPAYTVWCEDGRTLTAISVRNEKYRYAEFTAGAGGAMLLDEEKDPHEIKNVVDDPAYAQTKAELSKLVAEHRAKYKPPAQWEPVMSRALNYENPRHARPRGMLVTVANAVVLYPLAIAVLLYGIWFRAWYLLGRLPRLHRDAIPSSAVPLVMMAYCGVFAALPVFLAGIPINALHLHISGASNTRCGLRFAVMIVLWASIALLLYRDPMDIVAWVLH